MGGTGWEKPGGLTLQPEDFELLGLEALLGPAASGPTKHIFLRGGWTCAHPMEQGRWMAAAQHLLRILTPKSGGRQGGVWAKGWAVWEGASITLGKGRARARWSGRQCARLALQPLSRML